MRAHRGGQALAGDPSPLAEMTPLEETLADYRVAGLTTGAHVMAHLRVRALRPLAARGALPRGHDYR